MATYTTNLDLKKPAQSDKIRIADINSNMDEIDAAFGAVGETSVATQLGDIRGGMAIVSNGDTHDAIAAGQFVYVMNHSTLDDGLYTADSALAANASLTSSNVTAVSGGGLNALNSKITPSDISSSFTINSASSKEIYLTGNTVSFNVTLAQNNYSGTLKICDMPSAYKPRASAVGIVANAYNGEFVGVCWVYENDVYMYLTTPVTNRTIRICVTYII